MTSNHHLLYHLAERMLEQEKHMLLVDDLFDDEQIGDFVKSIQIGSPYQRMLLEGVLTESVRDEKLFVSFTVEGYFHYVLGEVIYTKTEYKVPDQLKKLIEENKLKGAKEGVGQCLIREAKTQDLSRLTWLIDESNDSLEIAVYPVANSCVMFSVHEVLNQLLNSPSKNDLKILGKVISFLDNKLKNNFSVEIGKQLYNFSTIENLIFDILKSEDKNEIKSLLEVLKKLSFTVNTLIATHSIYLYEKFVLEILNNKSRQLKDTLEWVSFISDLKNLDKACELYRCIIAESEKRNDNETLIIALEELGYNEYERSNRDGYQASIEVLLRAAEFRESNFNSKNDKLKNIYRKLAFNFLSLGLQLEKSAYYFEREKDIISIENIVSVELAKINYYLGLNYFWIGLRSIGRWGKADPSLLINLKKDPFDIAMDRHAESLEIYSKQYGKIHPETISVYHFLQETTYCIGNYTNAIPWLKRYVDIIPYKDREHTDNYYLYCLIVSLEETVKKYASSNPKLAISMLEEAKRYTKGYDEGGQITDRLNILAAKTTKGEQSDDSITAIDALQPLEKENRFTASWQIWEHAEQAKGFQTNPWLATDEGAWFYHVEKGELLFWNSSNEDFKVLHPSAWPQGVGRVVYYAKEDVFYAWSSIRSAVYQFNVSQEAWVRLSYGVHDVHACGASFGYDPVNKRLFEFGGYGYFTYKNWLWVYEVEDKKWIQIRENKPGIAPYPRNGQLLPIAQGESFLLLSGIGNDTGIQREHKARMGLASATDVGYFTWLRDAYAWDWKTMKWETLLSPNHASIRHEGVIGHMESVNMVFNWSGNIPSPVFGQESITVKKLTCWTLGDNNGFKEIEVDGDIPPLAGGYFQPITGKNELLYVHPDNSWKLTLHDR